MHVWVLSTGSPLILRLLLRFQNALRTKTPLGTEAPPQGWYGNSSTWCLGAANSSSPLRLPSAPPAPPGLTCVITLWLAFLRQPRPSLHRNPSHLLLPSPQPQTNSSGLSRGDPTNSQPVLRGRLRGRCLQPGACPLLCAAPSVPPRPRISFSPAAPSAAPAPLPAGELFSWRSRAGRLLGSLGRPLLTNSLSSLVPIPPPLGTSLHRSPSGSHHTPTSDLRLREAQGRRERSVERSGPRGCLRGPWGPETTSPKRLPGAPVAIHPRLSHRLAPLPTLSPSPCLTGTGAPRPPGFPRPYLQPALLPTASASSLPARCL